MKRSLLILPVLMLAACAHHRDVRPGDNGVHRVTIRTEDTEAGSREAISQARHYCDEKKKEAVFISEESKYTGDMDESTYKNSKRAAKVAQGVGSAVWVFGGKKESAIGGVAGLGGGIADQALGEGYHVDMRFKCQ